MAKAVLITDDSQLILDMNTFLLSSAGYKVYKASGGFEALEIMAQNAVDLVLVDVNMPGMDGYTLTKKIRTDKMFGEVPIVIITTEAEAHDKQQGFDAGANAYIIKPIQPEEMITQIKLLIGEP